MKQFSLFLSYLFHPLWMPLYIFVMGWYIDPYLQAFVPVPVLRYFMIILTINIIAPAISIWMLYHRGVISSLHMRKRKERFLPFLIVLVYYVLTYLLLRLRGVPIPEVVYSMILSLAIILILILVINFYWKISIHMAALGGALGTTFALSRLHDFSAELEVMFLIGISGLVAFARLYLLDHRPSEVYVGYLLGTTISFWIVYQQLLI